MPRLIDADAVIAELQKDEERFDKEAEDCRKNSRNYTDCYMQAMSSRADGIRDAIIEVYDAPTIDAVSVVHGKWKRKMVDNGFNIDWVCSKCGYRVMTDFVSYSYCPNCGAKMDGKRKESE